MTSVLSRRLKRKINKLQIKESNYKINFYNSGALVIYYGEKYGQSQKFVGIRKFKMTSNEKILGILTTNNKFSLLLLDYLPSINMIEFGKDIKDFEFSDDDIYCLIKNKNSVIDLWDIKNILKSSAGYTPEEKNNVNIELLDYLEYPSGKYHLIFSNYADNYLFTKNSKYLMYCSSNNIHFYNLDLNRLRSFWGNHVEEITNISSYCYDKFMLFVTMSSDRRVCVWEEMKGEIQLSLVMELSEEKIGEFIWKEENDELCLYIDNYLLCSI